jgi:predicted RNase H-like HicB family nuclease
MRRISMSVKRTSDRSNASLRTYSVYYIQDEEAGGYTAHVPALGIVTEGQTLRQAKAMARDASRVAVLRELKIPIPHDVRPELVEVEV